MSKKKKNNKNVNKTGKGFGSSGKGYTNPNDDAFVAELRRKLNFVYNIGDPEDQEAPDDWYNYDEPIELIEGENVPYGFNDD